VSLFSLDEIISYMSTKDPVEQNIIGVQSLVGSKMNKIISGAGSQQEGVDGEFEDELTLKLDDKELLELANATELRYQPYESKIKLRQQAIKTWYLGRQKEQSANPTIIDGQPISANLLFEAEETFLPAALSKNPEPVVWADNTPEGNELSKDVKTMLQFHADILVLRRKLTLLVRKWSLDLLGVMKHGWDPIINDIKLEVRDVKNFVFDPEGYIDSYGDYQGILGERIKVTASVLSDLYPSAKSFITVLVDGKMGTDVTYTQWWNDDYMFVTFKGKVLEKSKNPHFNYDKMEDETDQDGNIVPQLIKGNNHFHRPKKPYTFLSVFSLENQPHDETGLIEQNIPNQRRVSRRTDQIDFNLTKANNSDVFSGVNFNQETAKQASQAIAKGNPVIVPSGGPISGAIVRLQAPGVDGSFFNELENSKNDLRSIFGTQGITATQPDEDQTARGMILNQQYDNTRIGGGIGDALEQVADNIFNWWTQLYYVYYDEDHFAAIMGQMKAVEYIQLKAANLTKRLVVSVAADSMKPHDELTEMNQAMSLWSEGALDPKTLLTILNFPDPQVTAGQVVLWKTNPQLYMQLNFPDLAAQIQQATMAAVPQPAAGGAPPQPEAGQPAPSLAGGGIDATAALSNVPLPK